MQNNRTVKIILNDLQPELDKLCYLQSNTIQVNPIFTKKSFFDSYQKSKIHHKVKYIKHFPFLGPILLFIKRKIFKWHL